MGICVRAAGLRPKQAMNTQNVCATPRMASATRLHEELRESEMSRAAAEATANKVQRGLEVLRDPLLSRYALSAGSAVGFSASRTVHKMGNCSPPGTIIVNAKLECPLVGPS